MCKKKSNQLETQAYIAIACFMIMVSCKFSNTKDSEQIDIPQTVRWQWSS